MPRAATYTEFCRYLGIDLEAGQVVLAKVAFDGLEPRDLVGEERELARKLFGNVETIPPLARMTLVVVIGGRSGKTYLMIAIRALHLALTVDLSRLAPGEQAYGNIVAADLDLADQALRFVRGAINSRPELKAIASDGDKEDSKADAITITRRDGRSAGRRAVIKCRSSTGKGGKTGRGRSLFFFGMDEAALFLDSDYKYNDKEVFRANNPRVMAGGQTVVSSTPYTETGVLYEFWKREFGAPETAMVAHAPTRLMRTDPLILSQVDIEYARNPENAKREFGAEFMSSHESQFFDGNAIKAAVDPGLVLGARPLPGTEVVVGADFGFEVNSSTLSVVHRKANVARVAELLEFRPAPGSPLKPSVVCASFAEAMRPHGATTMMADAHYRESVREHLENANIVLRSAPEGLGGKAEAYTRAREQLHEGRVKLPNDERLLRQLALVRSRPLSGGRLSVSQEKTPDGSHGDLVSALVLALYQGSGHTVEAATPTRDSPEYEQRLIENLSRQRADEKRRPWWKTR